MDTLDIIAARVAEISLLVSKLYSGFGGRSTGREILVEQREESLRRPAPPQREHVSGWYGRSISRAISATDDPAELLSPSLRITVSGKIRWLLQ